MKKFLFMAVVACAMVSCAENAATEAQNEPVATEVVPAAATEVIPCAAPGPDAGGQVATEVVPAE